MKKRIIITIILGTIFTFLIYQNFHHESMSIITLGDGIALGQTAYEVQGYSYNDYLRDFYEKNSILEEYITEFSNIEETTSTLKMKMSSNYLLESINLTIQQAIAKAKIVTISLGMYELNIKKELKSKDVEQYLNNMDKILKLLRIYNDKEIILISLYPSAKLSKEKITEINDKLKIICSKYNIKYIDIENIIETKDYFFNEKSYYLNYKGHRMISEKIIEKINN